MPADRSLQMLAFEFDMAQPNNLSIIAFKETWKKAGQIVETEKEIFSNGFWGKDLKGYRKDKDGKTTYFRNIVIGDFLKILQVGFVCAQKDKVEHCKGSDSLARDFRWNYQSEQRLLGLKSKRKVPDNFKLYMRVQTTKGPVFMYTLQGEPMSKDSVATLTFAIDKGAFDTRKFLTEFAGNIQMSGLKIEDSKILASGQKQSFLYSWGQRSGSSSNYYLSCGPLASKKDFHLVVCATGDQSNYQSLHAALTQMAKN